MEVESDDKPDRSLVAKAADGRGLGARSKHVANSSWTYADYIPRYHCPLANAACNFVSFLLVIISLGLFSFSAARKPFDDAVVSVPPAIRLLGRCQCIEQFGQSTACGFGRSYREGPIFNAMG